MARTCERKRRTMVSDEAEVVRLYLDGWSAQKIGEKFGTTFSPIYRILREHGIDRAKTGQRNRKLTDAAKKIALEAFAAGANGKEAAATVSVSASSMSALLKADGIPSRRKVRELSADELNDIRTRYERGEHAVDIAKLYGLFHKRILAELNRMGVVCRVKRTPWTDKLGRLFLFRSDWERRVAEHLDACSRKWNYEVHNFDLDDCGRRRRYKPDFWIYGEDDSLALVIDVKGYLSPDQEHRIDLFRTQYPEIQFEIWNGKTLRELGLLDDYRYETRR